MVAPLKLLLLALVGVGGRVARGSFHDSGPSDSSPTNSRHTGSGRQLLPHPPLHGHGSNESKQYQGCLGLSKDELAAAWKFQGQAPPCSIVKDGTVVAGAGDDGSSLDGSSSTGSSSGTTGSNSSGGDGSAGNVNGSSGSSTSASGGGGSGGSSGGSGSSSTASDSSSSGSSSTNDGSGGDGGSAGNASDSSSNQSGSDGSGSSGGGNGSGSDGSSNNDSDSVGDAGSGGNSVSSSGGAYDADGSSNASSYEDSGSASSGGSTDGYNDAASSNGNSSNNRSSEGSGGDYSGDATFSNPLRWFNISDCGTYGQIWLWDLALTCENSTSLESCSCTTADLLRQYGDLECPGTYDDSPSCPDDCPICSTCMKLLGCSPDDVRDEQSLPTKLKQELGSSTAIPIAVGISAAFAGFVLWASALQYKKRYVDAAGLGTEFIPDDDQPSVV